ncbi:MAG: GNAT family N-acetyltransferase [Candidatus Heimdallarchaeota archaeon]|nr:GNAT family N-acetyltransferase [Candidatus Heimdallarchaeota archaeon]
MTLIIETKESIEDWEKILREYFGTIGITEEESIKTTLNGLQSNLKEKKQFAVCAFLDNSPCGFIIGRDAMVTLELTSFYLQPESYSENCGSKLVMALAQKGFEMGFKYFRFIKTTPFDKEPSFEEALKKDGFMLFQRARMILEITKELESPIFIPEEYQLAPFTINQVDDILVVMKEANPEGHTDYYIYPEMGDIEVCRKFFGSFSKDYTAFDGDLNPQIVYDGKVIGMSFVISPDPETAFIAEICVHPEHQRKGLGKALMNSIIEGCKKKGIKYLGLGVTIDNSGAYKLYEKLGFKLTKNILAIAKHK